LAVINKKHRSLRFNLMELNELDVRKQYQIAISNKFAALETLRDSEEIKRISKPQLLKRV